MKNVAYWTPLDEPAKSTTLIYVLAHPSREAAAANWKAFQDDPEWKAVRDKSEENGKLVEKVDSTFKIARSHVSTPVTTSPRMPTSACYKRRSENALANSLSA